MRITVFARSALTYATQRSAGTSMGVESKMLPVPADQFGNLASFAQVHRGDGRHPTRMGWFAAVDE